MTNSLEDLAAWFASAFSEYKLLFERSLAFSDDILHVFAGVVIQLAAAAAIRSSIANWRPFFVVLVAELANEALDITYRVWPHPGMQLGESFKDLLVTIALPLTLLIVSRCSPQLLTEHCGSGESKIARSNKVRF